QDTLSGQCSAQIRSTLLSESIVCRLTDRYGCRSQEHEACGMVMTDRRDLENARRLLASCTLFRGFGADERDAIVSRAHIRSFQPGDTIFTIGSPGDNMMAVLRGMVRISISSADGKELLLAVLSQGEVFGELAVLDG